jgi:cytochrome c550
VRVKRLACIGTLFITVLIARSESVGAGSSAVQPVGAGPSVSVLADAPVERAGATRQPAAAADGASGVAAGKAAFASAGCEFCHGPGAEGGSVGVALVPLRQTQAELLSTVRQGLGPMPPFAPDALADADVAAIYAYLASLAAPAVAPGSGARGGSASAGRAAGAAKAETPPACRRAAAWQRLDEAAASTDAGKFDRARTEFNRLLAGAPGAAGATGATRAAGAAGATGASAADADRRDLHYGLALTSWLQSIVISNLAPERKAALTTEALDHARQAAAPGAATDDVSKEARGLLTILDRAGSGALAAADARAAADAARHGALRTRSIRPATCH